MFEFNNQNFTGLDLGEHAENAFTSYSKYVVQDRALPDVRDGLKPVHRRIMFAQQELGNTFNKPFKKSARIIGDVLGKYHPHGDSACYQALVRMAQPWVMSAPLSSGQGNWGDTDKNAFAAMRYTEVRMSKIANGMMTDLKLDTVEWQNNYDNSEKEPTVLPTRFPNLVINGVEGIAIGMASSLPPHNPLEAMGCVLALAEGRIANEPVSNEALMEIMPAPDFPTGGVIHGLENFASVWATGRGSVRLRSEWEEEIIEGRKCIVIKALPYGVAPSAALIQVNEARRPHKESGRIMLYGVTGERDESTSEDGLRLVFEVDYGVEPELLFNELCNLPNSCFDISVSYNLNVIKDKKPESMGLRGALESFLDFREEVITNRTNKLLKDAQSRMHILEGLMKALNNIDQTIATIRSNPRNAEAKLALMELLEIDEVQAGKILEITLSKLTQGEVANYQAEYNQCKVDIDGFEKILSDKQELLKVIVAETNEQIDVFLDDKEDNGKKVYELRRSQWTHDEIKLTKEDIVAKENCAVLLSKQGYVRRLSSADLKEQQRGTQGSQQIELAKQDSLAISTECFSHDTLAFITSLGRVAFTRAFEVDTSMRGQHINNIIKLDEENNEQVIKIQSINMDTVRAASEKQLVIVTEKGVIKRSDFELFNPSRQVTVKAINLMDKDSIAFFDICSPDDQITIVTTGNRVVRYPLTQVRKTSRSSRGIIAVKLEGKAKVVACSTASPEEVSDTVMFMVSTGGLMKLSMLESIREVSRGCKGVLGMKLEEGDSILNAFNVKESEIEHTDIVTITKQGKVNRVAANEFRVRSRVTMGVRLARTKDGDELISAYPITTTADDDVEVE